MNLLKLLFNRQALTDTGVAAELDTEEAYLGLSGIERLRKTTSSDQVHIVDTGADARDMAIKLSRLWSQQHRRGEFGLISTNTAVPGATHVPRNDLKALHAAVDAHTVAIILQPLSSADLTPTARAYYLGAEKLCRELKILLVLDDTRAGLGRREALLCESRCGIRADMVVLGSGVDGGSSMAAVLQRSAPRAVTALPEHWGAVAA
ncbi:aminotransferase class III-fold pyridoxal phosphate-dependent enzyme [Pseudomonas sp. NA-150]|uniref:aminotransferase class III-fold pyridoxal phosphate-dependent enzyme n=1 Tax=Pseudomonas sp. NA-150 TaxID=3367525 RepID=UPI0037CA0BE0